MTGKAAKIGRKNSAAFGYAASDRGNGLKEAWNVALGSGVGIVTTEE